MVLTHDLLSLSLKFYGPTVASCNTDNRIYLHTKCWEFDVKSPIRVVRGLQSAIVNIIKLILFLGNLEAPSDALKMY